MNLVQRIVVLLMLLSSFSLIVLFYQWSGRNQKVEAKIDLKSLVNEIRDLEYKVKESQFELLNVNNRIYDINSHHKVPKATNPWNESIAVLVFVCDRAEAVKNHLDKLINQDCNDKNVADAVKQYIPNVQYIKHPPSDIKELNIPKGHMRYAVYYKIARHYKLALEHVFDKLNYTSLIITEDDLDISPDFFDYFLSTRALLEQDKTLYCVSAWNDNGKPNLIDMQAHDLLYRTDFFSGDLWKEIGSNWPSGFWDDWIREPEQRKNRSCIRPEISRTSMTMFGKKGASK